jgi:hypothetical protein
VQYCSIQSLTPSFLYPTGASTLVNLGIDVAISGDGSIIAIAEGQSVTGGQNAAGVKVFFYNSTLIDWGQLGSDLIGATGSKENTTVALSDDGTIVAAGWPGKGSGEAEVFGFSMDSNS